MSAAVLGIRSHDGGSGRKNDAHSSSAPGGEGGTAKIGEFCRHLHHTAAVTIAIHSRV